MARKPPPRRDDHDHGPRPGEAPGPGRPFNPLDDPHDEPGAAAPEAVSHGRPISEAEYKRLKQKAAEGGRPRAKSAQEDPSESPHDEDG